MAEETTEEPQQIPITYELYSGIDNLQAIIAEIAKFEGNYHLLSIIEFWCDFNFSEIAENGLVDTLRELLFGSCIENFALLGENAYQLACAQAAFYFNVFSDWADFFPWLFSNIPGVILYFFLALGRKINTKDPSFLEQKNALKEFLVSSNVLEPMLQTFVSNLSSSPSAVYAVLAAFSQWIDTSFVIEESFVTTMRANLSNSAAYPYIITLAENTITHAAPESQQQLYDEMLPLDLLSQTALSITDSVQPQIAFAEYLYFMTLYFFDNEEERLKNISYAIPKITEFPQTGILFLKVVIQAASSPDLAADMFSTAWETLVNLASADDANIENLNILLTNANYALHVLEMASKTNDEATYPILMEIFSNVDPINDTKTALAQMIFLESLSKNKKNNYTHLRTEEATILEGMFQLLTIDAASIAENPHALLIIYFLILFNNNNTLSANKEQQRALFECLFSLFTEVEISEEIIAVFDEKLPKFLGVVAKAIDINAQMIVALVSNFTNQRLESIALLVQNLPNAQEGAEIISQIAEAINGSEAEPEAISGALLTFIICLLESEQFNPLISYFSEIAETTTPYLEDDVVASLYILAYDKIYKSTPGSTFFDGIQNFLGIANGVKSITSIFKVLNAHIKEEIDLVIAAFLENFEVMIEKLIFIINQALCNCVSDNDFIVCMENFNGVYTSIINPSKKKIITKKPVSFAPPSFDGLNMGGFGLNMTSGLGQLKMDTAMIQPAVAQQAEEERPKLTKEHHLYIQDQFMPYLTRFYSQPKFYDRLQLIVFAATETTGERISECITACSSFIFSPEFDPNVMLYVNLFDSLFRHLKKLGKYEEEFEQGIAQFAEAIHVPSAVEFIHEFMHTRVTNNLSQYLSDFRKEVWKQQRSV